ncbi:MAG: SUMF1/EgtB/PvdO family nonheme iron enzyme [Gemmatimonadaceae bacterium]
MRPAYCGPLGRPDCGPLTRSTCGPFRRPGCGLYAGLRQLGDPRFRRMRGAGRDYLIPPMVHIEAGEYAIGEDEPYRYLGSETRGHMPRHTVSLDAFSIGRFPVTNAEWQHFLNARGYDDERWWTDSASAAWRSGEGTASGARLNARAWRDAFVEDPESLETALSKGEITDEVYARWKLRLAMSEDEFEAYLAEQYPAERKTAPALWDDSRFNNPAQPVVGICWYEACAYARWLSAQSGTTRYRLPTEVEWEAVARGPAEKRYATGDVYDPWKANVLSTRVRCTTPVGVFLSVDDPDVVADLTGNVWEWTSSAWGPDSSIPAFPYPYRKDDGREAQDTPPDVMRIVRGGCWVSDEASARAPARNRLMPDYRFNSYGVRLASDGESVVI